MAVGFNATVFGFDLLKQSPLAFSASANAAFFWLFHRFQIGFYSFSLFVHLFLGWQTALAQ